ncbi:Protein-glutamate methylesterase/protein-glutamine glutaminase [subsurface metagenome]
MREPISVLVVDDSALMRSLISRILDSAPDISIAGKAMNGEFALRKLDMLDVDIITLDLEMPVMNGIEFLKERRKRGIRTPVIILSSQAMRGAQVTMEALVLGASDFVLKPSGQESGDLHEVGDELIELVRAYGRRYKNELPKGSPKAPVSSRPSARKETNRVRRAGEHGDRTVVSPGAAAGALVARRSPGRIEIVAIGISTGGPNALRQVLPRIDRALNAPVVIVQHMPPGFTAEFAASLDNMCPLEVKEASDGDLLKPGRVLIAPGDQHMFLEEKRLAKIIRLSRDAPVNGHRPSAGVLFSSVSRIYKNRSLAIIMTGMGRDGAAEIGRIFEEGGLTLAQDEESCVVFGMPKAAIELGAIHSVVPLAEIAGTVNRLVNDSES